jgi:hypothetical protein
MKKQNLLKLFNRLAYVFLFSICAFSVVSLVFPEATEASLAFAGLGESGIGATMAATTMLASNTRESTDTARPRTATDPGHLKEDVSKFVTMIKPDDHALDTLLRNMSSSEKADDLIVNFEEVEFRGHQDQMGAVFTAAGTSTDADKFVNITVDNSNLWVKGETVYIPSQLIAGKPLQLRVDSINPDGTLKVTATNTVDNVVPSIADATVLYRSGTAHGELKASAENKTLIPGNSFNYCQRHMAQVDIGYIRDMIDSKSGFGKKDQNYIRMYDFRTEISKASTFGQRSKTPSQDESENIYYANGIYHQLTKQLSWTQAGGITNNTWIDWANEVFSDNSGSEDRLILGGSNLIAAISKIPDVQKQLEGGKTEIVAGVKLSKVETLFGEFYIKLDKLFDKMGHIDDGMVIDLTNIKRRPFAELSQRDLKQREAGIKNVNSTLIEEIFCLETRYLATHAKIVKTA